MLGRVESRSLQKEEKSSSKNKKKSAKQSKDFKRRRCQMRPPREMKRVAAVVSVDRLRSNFIAGELDSRRGHCSLCGKADRGTLKVGSNNQHVRELQQQYWAGILVLAGFHFQVPPATESRQSSPTLRLLYWPENIPAQKRQVKN